MENNQMLEMQLDEAISKNSDISLEEKDIIINAIIKISTKLLDIIHHQAPMVSLISDLGYDTVWNGRTIVDWLDLNGTKYSDIHEFANWLLEPVLCIMSTKGYSLTYTLDNTSQNILINIKKPVKIVNIKKLDDLSFSNKEEGQDMEYNAENITRENNGDKSIKRQNYSKEFIERMMTEWKKYYADELGDNPSPAQVKERFIVVLYYIYIIDYKEEAIARGFANTNIGEPTQKEISRLYALWYRYIGKLLKLGKTYDIAEINTSINDNTEIITARNDDACMASIDTVEKELHKFQVVFNYKDKNKIFSTVKHFSAEYNAETMTDAYLKALEVLYKDNKITDVMIDCKSVKIF